jgi:hypothetical protein
MLGMTGTIIAITAVLSHRSEAAYLPWAFAGRACNPPAEPNVPTLRSSRLGAAMLLRTTIDLVRGEIK